MTQPLTVTLETLTPIWTGGVDQNCDRLHETGLIGSLRWWYEALVRALGGYACDPTSPDRCPEQKTGKHCVACELFGCTGWARKFRLLVQDKNGKPLQGCLEKDQVVVLKFIPLKPIADEERYLLRVTILLIADYAALGGKTVFKPSDEQGQENALHHRDFGLVRVLSFSENFCTANYAAVQNYVRSSTWRAGNHEYQDDQGNTHSYAWASIQNFWCVKDRYLARRDVNTSTFNKVIGRKQPKPDCSTNRWLAGSQQESKKVFSFKTAKGKRTFGFVHPGLVDFNEVKAQLQSVWSDGFHFLTGEEILKQWFPLSNTQ